MQLKKLPIGIQTFSKIREENYIYIDKTDIALDLIQNYQYVFLSRPRRFGKSLFLDTLRNIFEGNKKHFKGLAIEDKWDWEVSYPVIALMMNDEFLILNDLKKDISKQLQNIARNHTIELDEEEPYFMLSSLLRQLYKKYSKRVVLLIDDADKPFRNRLLDKDVKEIHDFLLGFYITTKGCDEYIKFSMMTGIHPIKGDMLFGFNNFINISHDKEFGNICGFTQEELEKYFLEHSKLSIQNSKLKEWYNGYNFLGSSMYNPFDILQFIAKGHIYDNYWFESGTPTFLIELIKEKNYFLPNLSNLKVDKKLLNSFDIENLDLEVILYQAGYLTIDKLEQDEDGDIIYTLKIPNKEVKSSLHKYVIAYLYKDDTLRAKPLSRALRDKNLKDFQNAIISIFASIPYNNYSNNYIQNYEGFYASVIYVYLQSLGLDIIGEDVTNKGRIDLTIKMDNAIYILEFKVIDNGQLRIENEINTFLKQIKEKLYHQKYLNEEKDIYLVGIGFDKNERNIASFEWERL